MAVFAENGFGVELHAFNGQSFVAHAHDLAIFRPRGNFQSIRQTLAFNEQGMITSRDERVGQPTKYAGIIVGNERGLAMHEMLCMNDFSAKGLPYALVTQAYAQYGNLTIVALDQRYRYACFTGGAGT